MKVVVVVMFVEVAVVLGALLIIVKVEIVVMVVGAIIIIQLIVVVVAVFVIPMPGGLFDSTLKEWSLVCILWFVQGMCGSGTRFICVGLCLDKTDVVLFFAAESFICVDESCCGTN